MMILNLLLKLVYWIVPLGIFVWSLFQPPIASYVFIPTALFEGWLYLTDIFGKPSLDSSIWSPDEIEIIRKYHVSLRYPFGAKDMSVVLNGFRWSTLLWVPWLLWNHLWICAAVIAVNFFVTGSLSVRLDPIFFLSDAVNKGKMEFAAELALLQQVIEKMHIKKTVTS